jgi:MFS transporter, DHA1 family, inner membrane transport protein
MLTRPPFAPEFSRFTNKSCHVIPGGMAHTERSNWLTIITLFCAGLVGSMQFAKLSPIMQQVADTFGAKGVTAGLFVSVLGLVGVVFAIAVAAIANAFGIARSLRLALFGGAGVALLGAYAPEANSFLAGRILEGFSHLFIVVCTPALMANAATPKSKPLALALWGCFFGAGYAITSVAAPSIITDGGWRALLFAHGLVMLLVAFAVSAVTWQNTEHTTPISIRSVLQRHIDVLTSGAPLLLALTFFAYTIQFLATLTFLVVFMQNVLNWTPREVGIALAVAPLWSLIFTLLSGVLVRLGLSIRTGFVATFAVLALSMIIVFMTVPSPAVLITALAVMMACFGLLPGLAFANMPRIAPSAEQATLAYSAIALFGNLGTFLGTPILAYLHGNGSWQSVALGLVAMCLFGIGLSIALSRMTRLSLD